MPLRKVSDAVAQLPADWEQKIEDALATKQEACKADNVTGLTLAQSGREYDPSCEGPLGRQIELLEEFLDVLRQQSEKSMPE